MPKRGSLQLHLCCVLFQKVLTPDITVSIVTQYHVGASYSEYVGLDFITVQLLLADALLGIFGVCSRHHVMHRCHQEASRPIARVYKDVIFDTSPVAGKVYKNSENRRKQDVSCGFR